jgi:hypothetical protein
MAERTHVPYIDELIERMLDARVQGVAVRDMSFDPSRGRDQLSRGMCGPVTLIFKLLMRDAAEVIEQTDTHNDAVGYPLFHGYADMPFGPIDEQGQPPSDMLPDHCANILFDGEHAYMIDFTASQYGYTEHPLVQRMSREDGHRLGTHQTQLPDGALQREWQSG